MISEHDRIVAELAKAGLWIRAPQRRGPIAEMLVRIGESHTVVDELLEEFVDGRQLPLQSALAAIAAALQASDAEVRRLLSERCEL